MRFSFLTIKWNQVIFKMHILLWEKLHSSQCRKQISKSISMQAKFISDKFSWKRIGLDKVGEKGIGKVEGVTYWLVGKGGASFSQGQTWPPKCRCVWKVVNLDSYLAPDYLLLSIVKHMVTWGRWSKLEQLTEVFCGFFLEHCGPPHKTVTRDKQLIKVVLWAFSLSSVDSLSPSFSILLTSS